MKILIVQKSDLKIVYKYESDAPNQALYGHPWNDPNQTIHMVCSAAFDADCVKVVEVDGALEVQEDAELIAAKVEYQWVAMRQERDRRLSACDWTVLTDSPLNTTDKNAWKAYRQELRDLPENTQDPANPVWPSQPNAQI